MMSNQNKSNFPHNSLQDAKGNQSTSFGGMKPRTILIKEQPLEKESGNFVTPTHSTQSQAQVVDQKGRARFQDAQRLQQQNMQQQGLSEQINKLVNGGGYDNKVSTEERIRSGISILGSLPSTRFAVLEYFGSVYDDELFKYLSPISNDVVDNKTEIIDLTQSSILKYNESKPSAWSPIFSKWSIELLGQLSSKYSNKFMEKKGLTHSASLNELLQMWLNCFCTKSLIEIATTCIASMVDDTTNTCVDALLETSVRHAPHFDWVVAHIGSCFPRTIIDRVLRVGLDEYITQRSNQSAMFVGADDKFKSVVDILGHLTAQHSRDIKHALVHLFKASLVSDDELTAERSITVPFLLQLASMSPMLLNVLTTDLIPYLTPDVINRFAEVSCHWLKQANHDRESLMTLAVHLVTICEQGTLRLFLLILDNAFPTETDIPGEDQMETDVRVNSSAVRKCCVEILDNVLLDLSRYVHSKCADSSVDIPFLKSLQQHVNTLCKILFSSTGERRKCVGRLLKYVAVSNTQGVASHVLSQAMLHATNQQQLEYWLELEVELQIKHPTILKTTVHELLSDVVEEKHSVDISVQLLNNMLTVAQWESSQSSDVTRYRIVECLESHIANLAVLVDHKHSELSTTVLNILDELIISEVPIAVISQLCHSSVKFLFRAFSCQDNKRKFMMCAICRKFMTKLLKLSSAQKTLVRLLLDTALHESNCVYLGGTSKVSLPKKSPEEIAEPGLLQDMRQSQITHRSHGGVIGQGLRRATTTAALSTEEIQNNKQLFLDIFWTISCYSTTIKSQGSKRDVTSVSGDERVLTSHMSRSIALIMIELVTPDVIYNGIPWPEQEFIRVTIERDLLIRKKFEDNPILWDLFDFLSTGVGAMCYCSAIIRGLMATAIYYWDSSRGASTKSSPWQLQTSINIIAYMKKGHFIPAPLSYCGELLEYITPHEVYLILTTLWNFMKEKPPNPEERDWGTIDTKYTDVILSILHHNIDKFGHLYGRFFPPS